MVILTLGTTATYTCYIIAIGLIIYYCIKHKEKTKMQRYLFVQIIGSICIIIHGILSIISGVTNIIALYDNNINLNQSDLGLILALFAVFSMPAAIMLYVLCIITFMILIIGISWIVYAIIRGVVKHKEKKQRRMNTEKVQIIDIEAEDNK